MRRLYLLMAAAAAATICAPALGQPADDLRALVDALRGGGYVIVMRHASSPRAEPDAASAAPGNTDHERQLDDEGRATAIAMGEAIKRLEIPVGEVLSSPTFRAMQTARLLDLGRAEPIPELGDGGQGMRRDTEGVRSAWLRAKAEEVPPAGTNRLMITHTPNLIGAFPDAAADIAAGESLIIEPGNGNARVIARVKIEQWPLLAVPVAEHGDEPNAVDLNIETDGEFLAFKPTDLRCPAGAHVTLTFHHAGQRVQQQHDWVLLEPGTADAFMQAVLDAGEKNNWMPPHDPRVIAATPQIGPGETTMIQFTAPSPGDYPFVCTFAGHGEVMRGTLHVTARNP